MKIFHVREMLLVPSYFLILDLNWLSSFDDWYLLDSRLHYCEDLWLTVSVPYGEVFLSFFFISKTSKIIKIVSIGQYLNCFAMKELKTRFFWPAFEKHDCLDCTFHFWEAILDIALIWLWNLKSLYLNFFCFCFPQNSLVKFKSVAWREFLS